MRDIRTSGALTVAALCMALAAPAAAGTIYYWRTDAGGYAFASDLSQVPEKHRADVKSRDTSELASARAAAAQAKSEPAPPRAAPDRNSSILDLALGVPRGTPSGADRKVTLRFDRSDAAAVSIPDTTAIGFEALEIDARIAGGPETESYSRTQPGSAPARRASSGSSSSR